MAGTAVASGLMPHQKDEHDIWICKECGWKYPNAKPSPKIRKNHKKHCSGHANAAVPVAGGSSDDASDDEHHSSLKGSHTAVAPLVSSVESNSRSFDFAALVNKNELSENLSSESAPNATVGNRSGTKAAHDEAPAVSLEREQAEPESKKLSNTVAGDESGLMPHQKDEHDIWICKGCGWKYPNAKPSPKIKRNHKKHCPRYAGAVASASRGSSDDASDNEQASALKGAGDHDITATPVESNPRSFSFSEYAQEKEFPEILSSENPLQSEAIDGNKKEVGHPEAPGTFDKIEEEKMESESKKTTEIVSSGGLMLHQKDEHDIWVCKDCGWKYPNAKPSPKIRKNHKKQCPGKQGGLAAATVQGSSDEASDDENQVLSPVPVAVKDESTMEAAPVISRETEDCELEESPSLEVKDEIPSVEESPATAGPLDGINQSRDFSFNFTKSAELSADSPEAEAGTGKAGIGEESVIQKELVIPEVKKEEAGIEKELVIPEVKKEEAGIEKELVIPEVKEESSTLVNSTETPQAVALGGLMPHQKDEADVWICKDCGWKYPNSKPSPKIRRSHKNKCTGKGSAGASTAGDSSDETSDGEHSLPSTLEVTSRETEPASPAGKPGVDATSPVDLPSTISTERDILTIQKSFSLNEETPSTAVKTIPLNTENVRPKDGVGSGEPEAGDTSAKAREFTFSSALHTSNMTTDLEAVVPVTQKEDPTKPAESVLPATQKEDPTKPAESVLPAPQKEDPTKPAESVLPATQKEDPTKPAETEAPKAPVVGGLMPHQKDEADIWVCKECGWRYPNAKPSPKIRRSHKKKCPGKTGATSKGKGGSSGDPYSEDEKKGGIKCCPCL